MAKPIFVIGRNRSGTKWLSNILARNSRVACVQNTLDGVVETNVFDKFPRVFGDLSVEENFLGFVSCFVNTDFVRTTGLGAGEVYRAPKRDYFAIFRHVMDQYARANGKGVWLQKSSSLQLATLYEEFPDARFIVIQRDLDANLRSSIAMSLEAGGVRNLRMELARELLSFHLHRGIERVFAPRENVEVVRFEDLRSSPHATVQALCDRLELDFSSEMLETGFAANSSFSRKQRRKDVLSEADLRFVRSLDFFIRRIPTRLLRGLFDLRSSYLPPSLSGRRFVRGTFRRYRQELLGSPVDADPRLACAE